ncbi:MAG TPA: cell division protein ZapA [candidate division Zixibacteria bacterium]|nr:cell division protein ZapA [candidate division Zixibacteria bacterium]
MTENKVTVKIYGDEYPIIGGSDPSYISRVADFVDSKMKETARSSRVAARDKVAILAAMSIASELYENKDRLDESQAHLGDRIDSMIERLDRALAERA